MRDIDELLTLDERSSAQFILALRKRWADTVYPAFISEISASGIKVSSPQEGEIKLKQMLAQNKTRGGFLVNFQKVIDDYNSGSLSIEQAYEALVRQAEGLNEEQHRAAKNEMSEAEQELFDLLKKEKLTKEEEKKVKLAAKTLLEKLFDAQNKILIQEWHKEKASQEKVKREIQLVLGKYLPDPGYDRLLFSEKVDVTFQHFYELAQLGRGVAA